MSTSINTNVLLAIQVRSKHGTPLIRSADADFVSHHFTEIRGDVHKTVRLFSSQNPKHLDTSKLLKFVKWKYTKQSD